ncbi:formyltetrahydrofolate deformylase [Thermosynechococcaceae cyanobacterium Okahandja]
MTLSISCPDQRGLVAKLAQFVYRYNGNIIHADHHTDAVAGIFLSRLEWELEGFGIPREQIGTAFINYAQKEKLFASWQGVRWQLRASDVPYRLAIWVSRQDHCLWDLILRQRAGDLPAEIPLIISNHEQQRSIAEQFGIDFHYIPVTPATKAQAEAKQLQLLKDYAIDLVILAKYMQVLSPQFLEQFSQVMNIHHSFLPAFAGANPYHRAHERGVKIIGATAHYATADLDEGPIIEQAVVSVSHRDTVADLVRKGKDLERIVLARAVRLHLQNRILVYGNRTAVFA